MDFDTAMLYFIGIAGIIAVVTGIMVLMKKIKTVSNPEQYTEESVDKFSKASGILMLLEGVITIILVTLVIIKVPFVVSLWEENIYGVIIILIALPQFILQKTILKKNE